MDKKRTILSVFVLLFLTVSLTAAPTTSAENQEITPKQAALMSDGANVQGLTVMALVNTGDGYDSHILNFSMTSLQSGKWNPLKVEPGTQMLLFVLNKNMSTITNATLNLYPPMEAMGGSNPMMNPMMGEDTGIWQWLAYQGGMNRTLWQLAQNEGELEINEQGFAVFVVPDNLNGLWRGTVNTGDRKQGFFFQSTGNASTGGGNQESQPQLRCTSSPIEQGTSETFYVEIDGENPNGGTVVIGGQSIPYDGTQFSYVPRSEKITWHYERDGKVIGDQRTIYTESYSPGGSDDGGVNNSAVAAFVIVALVILLLVAVKKDWIGFRESGSGNDMSSGKNDVWE
jgi:hypothetical protein